MQATRREDWRMELGEMALDILLEESVHGVYRTWHKSRHHFYLLAIDVLSTSLKDGIKPHFRNEQDWSPTS